MEQLKRGISTLQHLVPTLSRFVLNPGKHLLSALFSKSEASTGLKRATCVFRGLICGGQQRAGGMWKVV